MFYSSVRMLKSQSKWLLFYLPVARTVAGVTPPASGIFIILPVPQSSI